MLSLSNMAQIPKHRCQTCASNYSTNNKTQVHHKAATPHIHILYLSKRLLKGGLTKTSHTFRSGETSSVPVHCLHAGPRCQHTASEAGPLGPCRTRRAGAWPGPAPPQPQLCSPPSAAARAQGALPGGRHMPGHRAQNGSRPQQSPQRPWARPPRSRHSPSLNSLEAAASPTPPP